MFNLTSLCITEASRTFPAQCVVWRRLAMCWIDSFLVFSFTTVSSLAALQTRSPWQTVSCSSRTPHTHMHHRGTAVCSLNTAKMSRVFLWKSNEKWTCVHYDKHGREWQRADGPDSCFSKEKLPAFMSGDVNSVRSHSSLFCFQCFVIATRQRLPVCHINLHVQRVCQTLTGSCCRPGAGQDI